jgi:hypothetical protein
LSTTVVTVPVALSEKVAVRRPTPIGSPGARPALVGSPIALADPATRQPHGAAPPERVGQVDCRVARALSTSGVAIGCSIAPSGATSSRPIVRKVHVVGERAKAEVGRKRWRVAVSDALVTGSSSRAARWTGVER